MDLIFYMSRADSMQAIELFLHNASKEVLERPSEQQRIATLVRAVDDCLWKQEYHFIDDEQATPEAREAIDELARDGLWWIRLFALHMMLHEPELFSMPINERLASDDYEMIRKEAAHIKAEIEEKAPAIPKQLRPLAQDQPEAVHRPGEVERDEDPVIEVAK